MTELLKQEKTAEEMKSLKKLTAAVYVCQLLTIVFAGLPLFIGALINLLKRGEVAGTWLESHFDWQVRTVLLVLLGAGLSALTYMIKLGFIFMAATLILLVYRIYVGWSALSAEKPIEKTP